MKTFFETGFAHAQLGWQGCAVIKWRREVGVESEPWGAPILACALGCAYPAHIHSRAWTAL
jgi:hypothetical protein